MNIRLVDTEAEFDALEEEWNRLADRTSASIFSSFDYVRLAWKHFHKPTDRLLILVFSDESSVVGIAPFCIIRSRKRGIPCRVVRFIAAWEGDRPRVLAEAGSEAEIWGRLFRSLEKEFTDWEILDLIEQPVEGLTGSGRSFLPRSGWHWESAPDVVDYFISLDGSWDQFLGNLEKKTRKNWRLSCNRLSKAPGGYGWEEISEPSRINEAIDRFIVVEKLSWKAGSKIGVAKDARHLNFYKDLVNKLSAKGQVVFDFLKIGVEDAATIISFSYGDTLYARHSAYLPAHASCSPGIIILADVLRKAFAGKWHEVDLLGLKEDNKANKYKKYWASGKRETIRLTGYRVRSRLLLLIAAKRFKRILVGQSERKAETTNS